MPCVDNGIMIFSNTPGVLVEVATDAMPVVFTVDGDAQTIHSLKAIVTSVGFRGTSGYQFRHTLKDFVYVYTFGERMGNCVVNGMAFPDVCSVMGDSDLDATDCSTPPRTEGFTGIERVINWYECNRITSRAAEIDISFGTTANFQAFLTDMSFNMVSQAHGIAEFAYTFAIVPRTKDGTDTCLPIDEDCTDNICIIA